MDKNLIRLIAQGAVGMVIVLAGLVVLHSIPELMARGLNLLREWIGGAGIVILSATLIVLAATLIVKKATKEEDEEQRA